MDLIDKIRAEVERRRSEYEDRLRFSDWYGGTEDRIKMGECKQILSFIDSLQEPEFPVTDEQVKEFLATHPKIKVPEKYKNPDWLFKKLEQPEVDLEKEIKDTCREYRINESHEQELGKRDIEIIARYFWNKGYNARKEDDK